MSRTDELTGRVASGAAFLDEHDPDWWKPDVPNAIDLKWLDLSNPAVCVLGQRCPLEVLFEFNQGRKPMAPVSLRDFSDEALEYRFIAFAEHVAAVEPERAITWGINLGFAAFTSQEYRDLTRAWTALITGRRTAAAA